MAKLYVLCGPSGSGKSTYAKELYDSLDKAVIVSTDFIRFYMFGDASVQLFNDRVFKEAYRQVEEYLKQGYDIIFDATNLTVKDRKRVLQIANNLSIKEKCAIYFDISTEKCIERQNYRDRKVPNNVIIRQHNKFVVPTLEEGFTEVVKGEEFI